MGEFYLKVKADLTPCMLKRADNFKHCRQEFAHTFMSIKKSQENTDKTARIIAEAERSRKLREMTYREKALKMYPWICGGCGREFSGKKLRELTVHHKDHNSENNPSDGSNWELLCLYCHDNEHERESVADAYGEMKPGSEREPPSTFRPFTALEDLLKKKK